MSLSDDGWKDSYDAWKLACPYEDEPTLHSQCDCCGNMGNLTKAWSSGIETYVCDNCRNSDLEGQIS